MHTRASRTRKHTTSNRAEAVLEHLEQRSLLSSLNPTGRDIGTLPTGVDSVVVIDITGDGARDLVYSAGNSIFVQRGRGGGGFDTPRLIREFNTNAGHLAVGDLNSDGRLDIFSAQIAAPGSRFSYLRALYGQAGGGFGAPVFGRTTIKPQDVTLVIPYGTTKILLTGAQQLDVLSGLSGEFLVNEGTLLSVEGAISKPILRDLDRINPVEIIIGVTPTIENPQAEVRVYQFHFNPDPMRPGSPYELTQVASIAVGAGVVTSLAAADLTGDGLRDVVATVLENSDVTAAPTSVASYTGRTVLLEQFIPDIQPLSEPPIVFLPPPVFFTPPLTFIPPPINFRDPITIHQEYWGPGGFLRRPVSPTYEIASVGDINDDGQADIAIAAVETTVNGFTGATRTAELFQLYRQGTFWGVAARTHVLTSLNPAGLPIDYRTAVVFVLADVRRIGRPDLITFDGPTIGGQTTVRIFFNTTTAKAPIIQSVAISPFEPVLFTVGSDIEVSTSFFLPDFASGSSIQSVKIYVDSNHNGQRDAGDLFVGDAQPPFTLLRTTSRIAQLLPTDPSNSTWFFQGQVSESWGLGSQVLLAEVIDSRGLKAVGASHPISVVRVTT